MHDLPSELGAYILVIDLQSPLAVRSPRPGLLPPGRYAYCGSAYGPGGIRARVRRHLRPVKALRWHVDRLTRHGRIAGVGVLPGGRECELVARLLTTAGARVPMAGLGSSDCPRCPAHLARVVRDFSPAVIGIPSTAVTPRDLSRAAREI
ncbi:MAG: DUF123 domain-containing protein [Alphaproteobacteria bacterium]